MIKIFKTTQEVIFERNQETNPIAFVPTMGNLHAGHISLLEKALEESKTVYFSIFVNPKQFGPNEDFNRYPRTLQDDINLIEAALRKFPNSKVIVYAPHDPGEVFPDKNGHTISVLGLSTILEGKIRPGHFDGVATVVHRLFEIVRPQKAYFGLKDYQQLMVIKTMVKDLNLPIEIIGMPIIREANGLAMSSRNQYLTAEQRDEASLVSKSLKRVLSILDNKKNNIPKAKEAIAEILKDSRWNYLEIRDAYTLSPDLDQSEAITLLAVYQYGSTRLLDNMQMEIK